MYSYGKQAHVFRVLCRSYTPRDYISSPPASFTQYFNDASSVWVFLERILYLL